MIMLKAPNGVTTIAGANAYAAKLANSPKIIISKPNHHKGSFRYANPPSAALLAFALVDDSLNPFFFIMNEAPMHSEDEIARNSPFVASASAFVVSDAITFMAFGIVLCVWNEAGEAAVVACELEPGLSSL